MKSCGIYLRAVWGEMLKIPITKMCSKITDSKLDPHLPIPRPNELMSFIYLQVDRAFEHLVEHHSCQERNMRFSISCAGQRGVYLRQPHEVLKPSEISVVVEPHYREDITSRYRQTWMSHVRDCGISSALGCTVLYGMHCTIPLP